jgi:hypothetical protein
MEAVPLRAGRAQCVSNMQQDMVEQTLAIIASRAARGGIVIRRSRVFETSTDTYKR